MSDSCASLIVAGEEINGTTSQITANDNDNNNNNKVCLRQSTFVHTYPAGLI